MTNFKTPPPPFCVDVINVWSLMDVDKMTLGHSYGFFTLGKVKNRSNNLVLAE